jgi:phosphate transport system permease protein
MARGATAPELRGPAAGGTPARLNLSGRGASRWDPWFKTLTGLFAAAVLFVIGLIIYELVIGAELAFNRYGLGFFSTRTWDPVFQEFGAFVFAFGTVYSSFWALVLSVPLAVASGVIISEYAPGFLRGILSYLIELLAAIPSIIYGLWGIFVLVPALRDQVMIPIWGQAWITEIPVIGALLDGIPFGPSMLAAGVILAIMILPFSAAVARDVIRQVPDSQREAALALGATKWESIRIAVLPYCRAGIIGGVILSLGRALGETMAVTMVIGNARLFSWSLFDPGHTIAAVIALEFNEASTALYLSALVYMGAVLFLVTVIMNALARLLVWSVARRAGGAGA